MTTDLPAPTREPTILGEYGEGYCRYCHFIEPLNRWGLLDHHGAGSSGAIVRPCKGVGTRPPKLTPNRSKLAAFTSRAPLGECPTCEQQVTLDGTGAVGRHQRVGDALAWCRGLGLLPIPPAGGRDHGGERG